MKWALGISLMISYLIISLSLSYYFVFHKPQLEKEKLYQERILETQKIAEEKEQREMLNNLKAANIKGLSDCLVEVDTWFSELDPSTFTTQNSQNLILDERKDRKDLCMKMFPQENIYK